MRHWYFIIIIVLAVYGCRAAQLKSENTLPGEIKVESYVWDFGRVKEGKVLKHKFIFKNVSDKDVTVMDITNSCSCTVSKAAKDKLAPWEEIPLEVEFNTKGYFGPTEQFVYVHTDNVDDPVVKFSVKADIVNSSK